MIYYVIDLVRSNDPKMTPRVPGVGISTPSMDVSSKTITRAQTLAEPLAEPRIWNTENLGFRLAADATAGFSAACMVAPVITIIDKYVLPSSQKSS